MSNGEFESTNLDELEKLEGVNLIAEWTEKDKSDELRSRLMLLELNRIYGSICYSGYLIICRTAKVLPFSRAIGYSRLHIDINDIEKITKKYNTLMIETKDLFGMNAILVAVDLVDEAYEEINKYISIAKKAVEQHKEKRIQLMKKYGWNDQEYYITTKKDERFSCWKNDGIFYMVEQPRECEKDYVQNEIKINEIKIDNILFYRVHYQHDYKANMYDVVSENSIKSVDNSFIVLKTKTETIELKISSLEALEALIPEKDYDRIEQSKENNTVIDAQVDEIAEIKKYKALLDEGIITEEDFEKKKKKLMGI